MKARHFLSAVLAIIPVTALSQSCEDPEIALLTELSDPEFWTIVDEGPSDSDELKRVVRTYAANNMTDEATSAIAEYLQRDDPDRDKYCDYCVSLLASVDRPDADWHVSLFFKAVDLLMEQSYEQDSGDQLLPVAMMYALSRNTEVFDQGLYIRSNAVSIGIDDSIREYVIWFLVNVERLEDAREVAVAAVQDHGSGSYQSDFVKEWIEFIDREIERSEAIGDMIIAGEWRH